MLHIGKWIAMSGSFCIPRSRAILLCSNVRQVSCLRHSRSLSVLPRTAPKGGAPSWAFIFRASGTGGNSCPWQSALDVRLRQDLGLKPGKFGGGSPAGLKLLLHPEPRKLEASPLAKSTSPSVSRSRNLSSIRCARPRKHRHPEPRGEGSPGMLWA